MEYFPVKSVKKDVTVISDCSFQPELVSPEKTKEGKEHLPCSSQTLQPLPMVSPETQDVKTQNTGLR